MEDLVLSQITGSTVVVLVIQWLKNTKLVPFIDANSGWINRVVALLFAALTAAGIHHNFDQATGTLTITGLTLVGVTHALWDIAKSYAMQHLIYKGIIPGQVAAPGPGEHAGQGV